MGKLGYIGIPLSSLGFLALCHSSAYGGCGGLNDTDMSAYTAVSTAAGNCTASEPLTWTTTKCNATATSVNGVSSATSAVVNAGVDQVSQAGAGQLASLAAAGAQPAIGAAVNAAAAVLAKTTMSAMPGLTTDMTAKIPVMQTAITGHQANFQQAFNYAHEISETEQPNCTIAMNNYQIGQANMANPYTAEVGAAQMATATQQMTTIAMECGRIGGMPGGSECASTCSKALTTVGQVQTEQKGMITALNNALAQSSAKQVGSQACTGADQVAANANQANANDLVSQSPASQIQAGIDQTANTALPDGTTQVADAGGSNITVNAVTKTPSGVFGTQVVNVPSSSSSVDGYLQGLSKPGGLTFTGMTR